MSESALLVNEVYPCIQGEGCLTGTPMVLVRFQGCSLKCRWCDTKYTWNTRAATDALASTEDLLQRPRDKRGVYATAETLAKAVAAVAQRARWVLVTGGEPTLQDLLVWASLMRQQGFQLALETNGSGREATNTYFEWVCLSPKLSVPGGTESILPTWVARANEIKFVIATPEDIDQARTWLEAQRGYWPTEQPAICIQPISRVPEATRLCVAAALHYGWRLSVQVHKYLSIQ